MQKRNGFSDEPEVQKPDLYRPDGEKSIIARPVSFPSDYVTNFPSDYVSNQQVGGHLLITEPDYFFFSFIFSTIARVRRRIGCCL
jgi:hypothetical protein